MVIDPAIIVVVPSVDVTILLRNALDERDIALFFDGMQKRLPVGLARDAEPLWANLEFLDGSRGAHVNISGISGVATKTTYATFLLYNMFSSGVLGADAINTKAVIYNVKGEDLLFLDKPNNQLTDADRDGYRSLGIEAGVFPARPGWQCKTCPFQGQCDSAAV